VDVAAVEGVELSGLRASPVSELQGSQFRYVLSLHEHPDEQSTDIQGCPTPMEWNLVDLRPDDSEASVDNVKETIGQLRRRLAYFVDIASRAKRTRRSHCPVRVSPNRIRP
jgi:hypothetical protein